MNDLRYALRQLAKHPGFTLVAVLTLALGVGANTAVFSVVNGVLLRALPYPESHRLVRVYEGQEPMAGARLALGGERGTLSPPNFVDFRAQASALEDMAAYHNDRMTLTGSGDPEQLAGASVTSGFFGVFGVKLALGRDFTRDEEDPGSDHVAVLSYGLWQRQFGADPGILERGVTFDGESYRVVGVAAPGFDYPAGSEIWIPRSFTPRDLTTQRGAHYLSVVARLDRDATIERASAELKAIASRLEEAYPEPNTGMTAAVVDLKESMVGSVRRPLGVMLAAVSLVLLIACANVANLSLVRAMTRERELSIRTALGASRGRLMRIVLAESLVLAVVGGAAGLILAAFGTDLLMTLQAGDLPRVGEVQVDWRVLGFTLGVSLLAGFAFGLMPALRASTGVDVNRGLKEGARGQAGTRGARRARSALVVAQIALAVVLVSGAGLVIRSFAKLTAVDPGFQPRGVATFDVSLPDLRYPEPAQRRQFFSDLLGRVRSLPGVSEAAGVFGLPFSGFGYTISVERLDGGPAYDRPGEEKSVQVRVVTPDYFRTLGIRLVSGRSFAGGDRAGVAPVVIVDRSAARLLWPGQDPLGHTLELGTSLRQGPGAPNVGGEVIGVVSDLREYGLDSEPQPHLYAVYDQFPVGFLSLAVRTQGDPALVVRPVLGAIGSLDPQLAVSQVRAMDELLSRSVAQPRFYLVLLSCFAAGALVLAAVGLYGVITYAVGQRTRELGLRMALGAKRGDVTRLVLRSGLMLVSAGAVLGLGGALLTTRLLRGLLFEVDPLDPVVLLAGTLVLAGVSVFASYVPARRAARIDPMEALRYE
jgi:putative ABC transport system permease protein